jgi:hypothetical protein
MQCVGNHWQCINGTSNSLVQNGQPQPTPAPSLLAAALQHVTECVMCLCHMTVSHTARDNSNNSLQQRKPEFAVQA